MQTELEFYTCLKESWQAMYDDCEDAQKSIFFEQYILMDDEVGNRFLSLFRDKAKEGVNVTLVLDGIGSRSVQSLPVIQEIRENGGTVHFYNNMRWWNIILMKRMFPRTHCKTMVIDDEISYIGGVCIAAYMSEWSDLHIRVTGPLVKTMSKAGSKGGYYDADEHFHYLVHHPRTGRNPIYKSLLQEIRKAKTSVRLCTPYFLPPVRLYAALVGAAKRGVDVQLMLAGKSDVPIVMKFSRLYFSKLMKSGVKIGLYHKTIMHAKYGIVDNAWATMGSTNLDYLSLLLNKEANIVSTRPDITQQLTDLFDNDYATCVMEK